MSEKIQPKVRFSGFTDAWEQRKLGDLADISRGASPRPIQNPIWFDSSSEVGWLRITDVTEQNGRIHHLEQHISKLGQEKTRVLTKPHLLLSIAATVGKPVVNYVQTGVHDGFLIFYNLKANREFVYQWLEMFRPLWQKYGQPGSQVNLNSELVKQQSIPLPSNDEQQEIVNILTKLDNTIALHQSKLEELKTVKKLAMQKIFDQEWRFKGFTDPWEQCKLGKLGSFIRNSIFPQKFSNDEFVEYSMPAFDDGKRPKAVSGIMMQSGRLKISGEVLLINKLNVRQRRIWLVENANHNAVASGEFMPFISDKVVLSFLEQLLLSDRTTRDLESISSGTSNSQKRVIPSDLLGYKIQISSSKTEQTQIATLLKDLDSLIAANQQKCDQLKKVKKWCMQNLFV